MTQGTRVVVSEDLLTEVRVRTVPCDDSRRIFMRGRILGKLDALHAAVACHKRFDFTRVASTITPICDRNKARN